MKLKLQSTKPFSVTALIFVLPAFSGLMLAVILKSDEDFSSFILEMFSIDLSSQNKRNI